VFVFAQAHAQLAIGSTRQATSKAATLTTFPRAASATASKEPSANRPPRVASAAATSAATTAATGTRAKAPPLLANRGFIDSDDAVEADEAKESEGDYDDDDDVDRHGQPGEVDADYESEVVHHRPAADQKAQRTFRHGTSRHPEESKTAPKVGGTYRADKAMMSSKSPYFAHVLGQPKAKKSTSTAPPPGPVAHVQPFTVPPPNAASLLDAPITSSHHDPAVRALPWNDPQRAPKRRPIVEAPPFMLPRRTSSTSASSPRRPSPPRPLPHTQRPTVSSSPPRQLSTVAAPPPAQQQSQLAQQAEAASAQQRHKASIPASRSMSAPITAPPMTTLLPLLESDTSFAS
jgi:hypothetical protein